MHRFASGVAALTFALGTVSATLMGPSLPVLAQAFGQQDVDQGKFILLAAPYGSGAYQLLVLEQLSDQRPCWSEQGANPILVDPLLTQFDFTGICARSTDSNGYSIRMAERDYGLIYQIGVTRQDNNLLLVGINRTNSKAPPIVLGQTNGLPPANTFAKFELSSGWRLTKRVSNGKVVGHVYLTSDTVAAGAPAPSAFRDTQTHWARDYIDALAARQIISGFAEDGTFRPEDPVTRVQFAAIVNKAFASAPNNRSAASFKDIAPQFWGFQPIQAAYQKGFLSGYPDNTFKPNQQIPRVQVLVALASGMQLPAIEATNLSLYQDASQIPGWATGPVAAATDKQIVVNYPNVKQLNPNREATRAEVAAFVYQALVAMGELPAIPSPYIAVGQ
mgnify:CR=1 FL=1